MKNTVLLNIIRWSARIIGTLIVAFTLFIGIGELLEGRSRPASEPNIYNIITFVVWGTGLSGLILAIWKEGLGGIVSLLCFIIFNILAAMNPTPGSRYMYTLLFFMLPSLLYLLYWWLKRNSFIKISKNSITGPWWANLIVQTTKGNHDTPQPRISGYFYFIKPAHNTVSWGNLLVTIFAKLPWQDTK